jgi:hypothetical protein
MDRLVNELTKGEKPRDTGGTRVRTANPDLIDALIVILIAGAVVIFVFSMATQFIRSDAFESLPSFITNTYTAVWSSVIAGTAGIGAAIIKALTREPGVQAPNYLLYVLLTSVGGFIAIVLLALIARAISPSGNPKREDVEYKPLAGDPKVWNLQGKVNELRGQWETVPQYGESMRTKVLEQATGLAESLLDVNDGSLGPSGHAIKREYSCYALIIASSTETDVKRKVEFANRARGQCEDALNYLESVRSRKDDSDNLKYTAIWIREENEIPFSNYLLAMAICLDSANSGRKAQVAKILERIPSSYLNIYPPDRDYVLKECR